MRYEEKYQKLLRERTIHSLIFYYLHGTSLFNTNSTNLWFKKNIFSTCRLQPNSLHFSKKTNIDLAFSVSYRPLPIFSTIYKVTPFIKLHIDPTIPLKQPSFLFFLKWSCSFLDRIWKIFWAILSVYQKAAFFHQYLWRT